MFYRFLFLFLLISGTIKGQNFSNDNETPLVILINPNAHQVLLSKIQNVVLSYCKSDDINSECCQINYIKFDKERLLENSDFFGAFNMLKNPLLKFRKNIYFHYYNHKIWNQDFDSMRIVLASYPMNSELILLDHFSDEWMFGLSTNQNEYYSFFNLINSFNGKNVFIGSCNSENLVEYLPKSKNYLCIRGKYYIKDLYKFLDVENILINRNEKIWILSE